ncbi:MAG: hypothetical protein ACTSW1_01005, partial [Candidatus Hodarchaeales archaeon]
RHHPKTRLQPNILRQPLRRHSTTNRPTNHKHRPSIHPHTRTNPHRPHQVRNPHTVSYEKIFFPKYPPVDTKGGAADGLHL